MDYQKIENEIIKETKKFAKSYGIHYDKVTETMVLNAIRELNKYMTPFLCHERELLIAYSEYIFDECRETDEETIDEFLRQKYCN